MFPTTEVKDGSRGDLNCAAFFKTAIHDPIWLFSHMLFHTTFAITFDQYIRKKGNGKRTIFGVEYNISGRKSGFEKNNAWNHLFPVVFSNGLNLFSQFGYNVPVAKSIKSLGHATLYDFLSLYEIDKPKIALVSANPRKRRQIPTQPAEESEEEENEIPSKDADLLQSLSFLCRREGDKVVHSNIAIAISLLVVAINMGFVKVTVPWVDCMGRKKKDVLVNVDDWSEEKGDWNELLPRFQFGVADKDSGDFPLECHGLDEAVVLLCTGRRISDKGKEAQQENTQGFLVVSPIRKLWEDLDKVLEGKDCKKCGFGMIENEPITIEELHGFISGSSEKCFKAIGWTEPKDPVAGAKTKKRKNKSNDDKLKQKRGKATGQVEGGGAEKESTSQQDQDEQVVIESAPADGTIHVDMGLAVLLHEKDCESARLDDKQPGRRKRGSDDDDEADEASGAEQKGKAQRPETDKGDAPHKPATENESQGVDGSQEEERDAEEGSKLQQERKDEASTKSGRKEVVDGSQEEEKHEAKLAEEKRLWEVRRKAEEHYHQASVPKSRAPGGGGPEQQGQPVMMDDSMRLILESCVQDENPNLLRIIQNAGSKKSGAPDGGDQAGSEDPVIAENAAASSPDAGGELSLAFTSSTYVGGGDGSPPFPTPKGDLGGETSVIHNMSAVAGGNDGKTRGGCTDKPSDNHKTKNLCGETATATATTDLTSQAPTSQCGVLTGSTLQNKSSSDSLEQNKIQPCALEKKFHQTMNSTDCPDTMDSSAEGSHKENNLLTKDGAALSKPKTMKILSADIADCFKKGITLTLLQLAGMEVKDDSEVEAFTKRMMAQEEDIKDLAAACQFLCTYFTHLAGGKRGSPRSKERDIKQRTLNILKNSADNARIIMKGPEIGLSKYHQFFTVKKLLGIQSKEDNNTASKQKCSPSNDVGLEGGSSVVAKATGPALSPALSPVPAPTNNHTGLAPTPALAPTTISPTIAAFLQRDDVGLEGAKHTSPASAAASAPAAAPAAAPAPTTKPPTIPAFDPKKFIGERLAKRFDDSIFVGTITKCKLGTVDGQDDVQLWEVFYHEDGDEEDLELKEVKEHMALFKTLGVSKKETPSTIVQVCEQNEIKSKKKGSDQAMPHEKASKAIESDTYATIKEHGSKKRKALNDGIGEKKKRKTNDGEGKQTNHSTESSSRSRQKQQRAAISKSCLRSGGKHSKKSSSSRKKEKDLASKRKKERRSSSSSEKKKAEASMAEKKFKKSKSGNQTNPSSSASNSTSKSDLSEQRKVRESNMARKKETILAEKRRLPDQRMLESHL